MRRAFIASIKHLLFGIIAMFCVSQARAQVPPTPPGPPGLPTADLRAPQTFSGVVRIYLVNEFGDVEGVIAQDGTQVRFPPHMGPDLVRTLKPGDRFVAQGEATSTGAVRAYALGKPHEAPLTEARPSRGATAPLPREARAASLVSMQADGTIAAVLTTVRGDVDGVVLVDDTIVRFPPHSLAPDSTASLVGKRLSARGYGTRNAYGKALRADAVGLDGRAPGALQPPGPTTPPTKTRASDGDMPVAPPAPPVPR